MVNITIKSKCYQSINTVVDGRTFKILPKGNDQNLWVTKVTDHMEQLQKDNKIKVIINKTKK